MKRSLVQAILALIFTGVSLALDVTAQEILMKRVSFRLENQGLRKVFKEIENQTNIRFAFRPRLIPVDHKTTVIASNEALGEVLNKVVKPLRLRYEVVGRQIIISPIPQATEPEASLRMLTGQPALFSAADQPVTGTVSDEAGQALPGVSVVVKGTSRGTSTDATGMFRLSVPDPKSILVFSYVGYESQEMVVNNQTTFTISLKADNKSLNEVVVVGYGTQKKADLTGPLRPSRPINSRAGRPCLTVKRWWGRWRGCRCSKPTVRPVAKA